MANKYSQKGQYVYPHSIDHYNNPDAALKPSIRDYNAWRSSGHPILNGLEIGTPHTSQSIYNH